MLKKIISGGQTGADRVALDFAIARGIPHGGWCPLGRLAEDGMINRRYQLTETPTADYSQRTEWNARDSDGTVIFTIGTELIGGSAATAEFTAQQRKPWLHLAKQTDGNAVVEKLRQFLNQHGVGTLNVAGSRASEEPAVGEFTRETLDKLWEDPGEG